MAVETRQAPPFTDLSFEILHLADAHSDPPFSRALCGKVRDKPLRPGATGEFCVVCTDISQARRRQR